ncbi:MAG: septum formation initiator [Flavobacterium sp. BFFFF1]|uniref:FtsB family cell division protein n=1 Tax=unclassified Flavobacterium TaxID=196869 RepID=UPI000BD0CDF8|nr:MULTISPECIES: septum formation initiator family protein [unclassified Flavobacterium]OYU80512.1 MAG: septum formation initiator [Flavobacterium sp. BFFFF1]
MKNPLKNSLEKRPLLRFLSNRYVLVLLFFAVWMLFLDNYSWLNHRLLDKDIDELEDNKHYYEDEIKKDVRNIKILKDSNQIEKFAREKYYMKRDSEDIYIIEFEGDTVKKDF